MGIMLLLVSKMKMVQKVLPIFLLILQSVSIYGTRVVIGAHGTDDPTNNKTDVGAAYVFHRQANGVWTFEQKLMSDDGDSYDYFGFSVDMYTFDYDYVLVGSYRDDDNGSNSGSAYVFYWSGSSWIQQAKLTASDGAIFDYFGADVSIDGSYAVVGAYGDDNNGYFDSGSTYVFYKTINLRTGLVSWTQQAKLTASDGDSSDVFDESIDISGNTIIIGAEGHDSGYIVQVLYIFFKRLLIGWLQTDELFADDGDYAIVGSPSDDIFETNSGSAYLENLS